MKIGEEILTKDYEIEIIKTTLGCLSSNTHSCILIEWNSNVGFGVTTIHIENNEIEIDTECMSSEFVFQLMIAWTKTMERRA